MSDDPFAEPPIARRRLVVGISGGPGLRYGLGLLRALRVVAVETHAVISDRARSQLSSESGHGLDPIDALADHVYAPTNQAARISSGSFPTDGMIIAPCGSQAVAAIATGFGTSLIHRAADVVMKEHRRLVLLHSEPLDGPPGHLQRLAHIPSVMLIPMPARRSAGRTPETVQADAEDVERTVRALLRPFGLVVP